MSTHKGKLKIILIFTLLFLAVTALLILIFFAGKKTYVVRYDINGGTLISGSLEQHITQGQNATPPTVVKDGAYLHSWSASSNHITKDMVITAVWNYETTKGIIYSYGDSQNFAEITGAYKYISGEVYLGSYYEEKRILGIGTEAFANCQRITKIYLLDGLLSIGDGAFSNCTSLTEIEIPKTVSHLGKEAFKGCEKLEIAVLHEGLLEIGAGAFEGCSDLKEIVIPSTVKSIGEDAFLGCESLEKVVFEGDLEQIPNSAFNGCSSLTEITLPSTIKEIGNRAFASCSSLKDITLNDGLLIIGREAFDNCESLKEVEVPASVASVGKDAFAHCDELTIIINAPEGTRTPLGWAEGWNGGTKFISWEEHQEEIENGESEPDNTEDPDSSEKTDD